MANIHTVPMHDFTRYDVDTVHFQELQLPRASPPSTTDTEFTLDDLVVSLSHSDRTHGEGALWPTQPDPVFRPHLLNFPHRQEYVVADRAKAVAGCMSKKSTSTETQERGRAQYRMTPTEVCAASVVLTRNESPERIDDVNSIYDVEIDEGYVSAPSSFTLTTKTDDMFEQKEDAPFSLDTFKTRMGPTRDSITRAEAYNTTRQSEPDVMYDHDTGDDASVDSDSESGACTTFDSDEEIGTPDSCIAMSPPNIEEIIDDILDSLQLDWVFDAMQDVRGLFASSPAYSIVANGESASTPNTSAVASGKVASASSAQARCGRKRSDDEFPSSNREGDNKRRKVGSASPKLSKQPNLKLACPFYKHDPSHHGSCRSCAGPGWDTIHRVKEHIYRRHALPTQCARCHETFPTEPLLNQHQRSPDPCEVREGSVCEGFNKEQERKLRSKKRTRPNQTDAEKWREVYLILFPDTLPEDIPSPYYTQGDSEKSAGMSPDAVAFAQYDDFYRRELVRRVRNELERAAQPLGATLRDHVIEIVRNCQGNMFQSYQLERTSSQDSAVAATQPQPVSMASTARSLNSDHLWIPPPTLPTYLSPGVAATFPVDDSPRLEADDASTTSFSQSSDSTYGSSFSNSPELSRHTSFPTVTMPTSAPSSSVANAIPPTSGNYAEATQMMGSADLDPFPFDSFVYDDFLPTNDPGT